MQQYSRYSSGSDFEQAVFGLSSNWDWMREQIGRGPADFSGAIRSIIERSPVTHPSTKIGESLHRQVTRHLGDHFGINPEGLIFLPSVDTKVDFFHGADGFFYLPSLFPYLVTVDAFNIHPRTLLGLREAWIDESASDVKTAEDDFTDENAQSNLFLFKKGMTKWYTDNREILEAAAKKEPPIPIIRPADFRSHADRGRWENHFIFTPYHASSYGRRRNFAKLVAGYFAKVAEVPNHKNMALLSH
jgi:hypothetical protein